MADEEKNETREPQAEGETVSAPEGPVAPAAERPVRDSGPVEGAPGEPGGSPGGTDAAGDAEPAEAAEEPSAEVPVSEDADAAGEAVGEPPEAVGEPPVADAEPAPDVEAEAAAAEAPAADAPTPEAVEADAEAAPTERTEGEGAAPSVQPEPKKKRKRVPRSERRQRSKPTREKPATPKPIVRLPKPEHERGQRQERRGVVVSSAMDKTIVVKVDTIKAHPRYKKVVRRSQKFHAHDEQNAAKTGDVVRIVETRPISKTKNWRLAEVVEAAR